MMAVRAVRTLDGGLTSMPEFRIRFVLILEGAGALYNIVYQLNKIF